jgi:hypothetical protein
MTTVKHAITEAQAIRLLRLMMWQIQRIRSMAIESLGDLSNEEAERVLAITHPWLSPERNVLRAVDMILARVDRGEALEPLDFYNMMVICDLTPLIQAGALFSKAPEDPLYEDRSPFPRPDIRWFQGWAEERALVEALGQA